MVFTQFFVAFTIPCRQHTWSSTPCLIFLFIFIFFARILFLWSNERGDERRRPIYRLMLINFSTYSLGQQISTTWRFELSEEELALLS